MTVQRRQGLAHGALGRRIDDEQEVGSTRYVDILDFAKTDQGRWYDTIRHLNAKFDEQCSDGSCGGPYEKLTPLTFACSVSTKLGSVHECVWTFASTNMQVDTRNANVLVDAPTFKCRLTANIYSAKLIPILEGNDPLHAALPGGASSTTPAAGRSVAMRAAMPLPSDSP